MYSILKPGVFTGTRKAEMPRASPGLARGARKHQVDRGGVHAGVEPLHAVDHPVAALLDRGGLHEGGVGAVQRLGQAEADALRAGEHALDVAVLLLLRAEAMQQQRDREVADDRALVLQVVVQAQPLVREMLADDRHGEVRAVLAAQRLGQAEAQVAGLVGAALISASSSSHSWRGWPSLSQSVRACSRRWSKKRMLSSCCSSGRISRSMKASSSAI